MEGKGFNGVAGDTEFAILALQLAFFSVFLALLTATIFDFSQLRHTSRFFVLRERVKIQSNIRRNVSTEIVLHTVTIHLEIWTIRTMDATIDQQVAMDEALFLCAQRLRIGRSNF
nr:hypothetical protein [Tanacetum cinerariifolium]